MVMLSGWVAGYISQMVYPTADDHRSKSNRDERNVASLIQTNALPKTSIKS